MAKVKVPFGERYRTSKAIFRESMGVLRQSRDLWLFPILAGATMLMMVLVMVGPLLFVLRGMLEHDARSVQLFAPFLPLVILPLSYPFAFVMTLLQSALSFGLHERMAGRRISRRSAFARAWSQKGAIARFNLLAMLVTGILMVIGQLLDKLRIVPYIGQAVNTVGAFGWAVASFFVIPAIVVKQEGTAIGALRESTSLARKQWGKATAGMVTIGLVFLIPMLVILFVMVVVVMGTTTMVLMNIAPSDFNTVMPLVIGGLLVVMMLPLFVLMPIQMAANAAYQTGLYRFATTGRVPRGFSKATIVDAWEPYRIAAKPKDE